jgi:hypothetical protein
MKFMRIYWSDLGILCALLATLYIYIAQTSLSPIKLVLWISLVSLFLHQYEEYRIPGGFPLMLNCCLFGSNKPDRYPLNTQTALIINVCMGWILYLLAAVFSEHALWIGIASIAVSIGNVIAHVILFNIKGKTIYNPGMGTATVFFLPISYLFFSLLIENHLASASDYAIGITLGIVLNYVGIFKLIGWLKDENTPYIFISGKR